MVYHYTVSAIINISMKIIIIFLFVLTNSSVQAQSTICPALNSFTGEWRYTNGQDTIRIYLRSNDYALLGNGDTTIGKIWGWHEYKQGNTIVESNYDKRFITLPTNSGNNTVASNFSISLQMPYCDLSGHKLIGYISDITQCYETKIVTIQFNAAVNQMTWKQINREGFGFGTGCYGMTLPREFVLTKQ